MPPNLKKILFSSSDRRFNKLISELRWKLCREARFGGFDKESDKNRKKILNIIREVDQKTDKTVDRAVRRFTKLYDKIDIKPEEFKISKDDLYKAHKEISKELLASIRRSITNVRKYQEEIFIGNKTSFSLPTGIR